MSNRLRLEVLEGAEAEPLETEAEPLETEAGRRRVLGRDVECDLVLTHSSVSRRHAEITWAEDGWLVTDAGSRHGTTLNTIRLVAGERARLRDGDVLRTGAVVLAVVIGTSGDGPATASSDPVGPARGSSHDSRATRASIFLRLQGEGTTERELTWQEFVARYRGVIVGFARRAGLRAQDADDVLQEVLLGFFRVSEAFEYDPARGRFRGYLKRVTLNAIRARARTRRARPEHQGDVEAVAPDDARADRLWNQEWSRQVLNRALEEARSHFGPTTWEAFHLYGQRGVPAEEVAAQLGMSASAVRHAKSRAARTIRACMDRIHDEE